jgi:hypothetical protein
MADVVIEDDTLRIKLSLLDQALAFHSSFEIPLSHVTNAYVSDLEDLQLQYAIEATNFRARQIRRSIRKSPRVDFRRYRCGRLPCHRNARRTLSTDRGAIAKGKGSQRGRARHHGPASG